jgi:hypothetical protein
VSEACDDTEGDTIERDVVEQGASNNGHGKDDKGIKVDGQRGNDDEVIDEVQRECRGRSDVRFRLIVDRTTRGFERRRKLHAK